MICMQVAAQLYLLVIGDTTFTQGKALAKLNDSSTWVPRLFRLFWVCRSSYPSQHMFSFHFFTVFVVVVVIVVPVS